MAQLVMLGTLLGLVVLIFWLVLRFDPEARRAPDREREQ
jgi:flagellar biogenesis protein FliO